MATVWPTKSGKMVEARDQVLMIFRSRVRFMVSILRIRLGSTNQPFFVDRDTPFPPYRVDVKRPGALLLPSADDQMIGPLVAPRLIAQRRLPPGRLRLAADRRPSLAAAMGMIDRIHHRAAHGRPPAHPAG